MGVAPIQSRKPLKDAKPGEYVYTQCRVEDLAFEHGCCGERFDGDHSPFQSAKVALAHNQTVAPAGYLLIPFFGKLHYVSPALYRRDAAKFHELHWKEAWHLLDGIRSNRAVYDEWANPRRFIESLVANAAQNWGRLPPPWDKYIVDAEAAPKPDIRQFDALSARVFEVIDRLVEYNYDADKVAKNGFDLQAIRQDSEKLLTVIRQYRENCIESAEQIAAGLETVESTAFQILNIIPTITFMDPLREAAYRISILLLRAGARGVGGYLAEGTTDGAVREALAIIQREAPDVIVNVILIPVQRLCLRAGMGRFTREACVLVIKQVVEFTCGYVRNVLRNADGQLTDQELEELLSQQLAVLVGDIAGIFLGSNLGEKAWKTLVKSIADSMIRTLLIDINNAKTAAREQGREVIEVLMSDLPGTIMRIVQGAVVGLIQRRAQQSSQFIDQQRAVQGGTTFGESMEILWRSRLGEWARSGTVDKNTLSAIQQRRHPLLPQYTYLLHTRTGWRYTNLDYLSAMHVRRWVDINELVLVGNAPSIFRRMHTDTAEHRGAKSPKPMAVKAKTSNHPEAPEGKKGLVVKPVREGQPGGPTHTDYNAAYKTWMQEQTNMFASGHMVREDGVVFHPDQLDNWAKIHPEDAADCAQAVKVLKDAAAKGYNDLTEPPPSSLPANLAAELARVKQILNKAGIGYYPDLDLVEVIDFISGTRRFMGDKGDGSDALRLARDNRQHLNDAINIHDDYLDQEIPDGIRAIARLGDAVQHGGSREIEEVVVAKTFDRVQVPLKHIFMAFPNGEVVVIDASDPYVAGKIEGLEGETRTKVLDWAIADRIEMELKSRLGDKYQDFANRGLTVRISYVRKSTRYTTQNCAPPPVNPKQLSTIHSEFGSVQVLDEPGLGFEVTRQAIEASLLGRRMLLDDGDIKRCLETRIWKGTGSANLNREVLWNAFKSVVAVDCSEDGEPIGENIVIAASHFRQSIADAVYGLMSVRRPFGQLPANVRVWYELYTAYLPLSTDYIANRIGGPDPGVEGRHLEPEMMSSCSCFKSRKDERLYAFAAGDFEGTFAPTHHKSVLDKRPVQGLILTEVWEHQKRKTLTYRKAEGPDGQHILVFPEPVIVCPVPVLQPSRHSQRI